MLKSATILRQIAATSSFLALTLSASAQITLVGVGVISDTATDLSGLTGTLTNGNGDPINGVNGQPFPHNLLGAFGSSIAYTGFGNTYLVANDRGFGDGVANYSDRFHTFDITVNLNAALDLRVTPTIQSTTLLRNEAGQNLIGLSSAFDATNSSNSLRFDPEGMAIANSSRSIYLSDEYGPFIYEFDRATGQRIRVINLPDNFKIANPNGNGAMELPPNNTSGRQANRGMEGLAISPDGTTLFGLMQSPLIQDGALNASNSRRGINIRLLKVDIATGATQEFLYQLENGTNNGTNEILAINDHEFLVIERDGRATNPVTKRIYRIDLTGATDISNIASLPQTGTPANVTPVSKSLFLDLLDPAHNYQSFLPVGLTFAFPEKIEGITFGPTLSNGDQLFLVLNDNDLLNDGLHPNYFFAFSVPQTQLASYQAQAIVPEPGVNALLAGMMITGAGFAYRRIRRNRK